MRSDWDREPLGPPKPWRVVCYDARFYYLFADGMIARERVMGIYDEDGRLAKDSDGWAIVRDGDRRAGQDARGEWRFIFLHPADQSEPAGELLGFTTSNRDEEPRFIFADGFTPMAGVAAITIDGEEVTVWREPFERAEVFKARPYRWGPRS